MWARVLEWIGDHTDLGVAVGVNAWLVYCGVRPALQALCDDLLAAEFLADLLGLVVDPLEEGFLYTRCPWADPWHWMMDSKEVGKAFGYVCWDHDIHGHEGPKWMYSMICNGQQLWGEVCCRVECLMVMHQEYQRRVNTCQTLVRGGLFHIYCEVTLLDPDGAKGQYFITPEAPPLHRHCLLPSTGRRS